MAESVRLFAKLRQWLHGRTWQASPSLIADFRFDLRPRRFPCRNVEPETAISELAADTAPLRSHALGALLAGEEPRRLAAFQLEASKRILRGLSSGRRGGTIVTAGTGSGKTLAFYLPALSWLVEHIRDSPVTRIVAIYPRNELLKDQLTQCLAELDRLGEVGPRAIRVGALFGATPRDPADVAIGKFRRWEAHGSGGRICAFVQCPRCRSQVVWADEDRGAKPAIERLSCTACAWASAPDTVLLTRDSLKARPPDVLFTTTEMLNRLLSNPSFRKTLGISATPHPSLMLLDEVHTYGGTSGAQVAHLMRRWHQAVGGNVQFVGLSATLADAEGFFSRLTGLYEDQVREITPAPSDLSEQGMEYLLALRGNPMTQTALLSASIQALMLSARIVDPVGVPGVAGSRVFAFTDKLDLANRLFHFYSDAEGWGAWGRVGERPPLASLRSPDTAGPDKEAARLAGQVWDGPTEIGHELTQPRVRVGLTTSQRAGVQDREVIVATASLEVGYNDDRVGLVLQHKAPRDPAAFLQRRGRAGRRREQRPWTVVVLSDYGRDRVAYHNYDQLFDPALPPRSLPVANVAVRRMQATYATLDWLSREQDSGLSVWDQLTGPSANAQLAGLIERTIAEPTLRHRLQAHLSAALAITPEEAEFLMWAPPRAVLTEVLPTARRRLLTGWFHGQRGEHEDLRAANSPLPDFVPPNLFSDLLLPEVTVTTPRRKDSAEVDEHVLPIFTALTEFAPGNVTFRFASEGAWEAGWVPVENVESNDDRSHLDLGTFCAAFEELAPLQIGEERVRLIRPWRIRTVRRPGDVLDTSYGRLHWSGGPEAVGPGVHLDLPDSTGWQHVLRRVSGHLHSGHGAVRVRRAAAGFEAEIGRRSGTRDAVDARFTLNDNPAAVGYEYDADAIVFHLEVPHHVLLSTDDDPERAGAFRAAWFAHSLDRDSGLGELTTAFQRQQLERACLAAIADAALQAPTSLTESLAALPDAQFAAAVAAALEILYGTDEAFALPQRGLEELKDLCDDPAVISGLRRVCSALTEPLGEQPRPWARRRFTATMAAALSEACQLLCPEFDVEGDSVMDLVDPESDGPAVWLTERSPGGGGIVDTLARRLVENPRRFIAFLDRVTRPSDFEVVDRALQDVLIQVRDPRTPLADAFAAYRAAETNVGRSAALHTIRRELPGCGVPPVHAVIAAISTRLLRLGSTHELDRALAELVDRWAEAEATLGVELDPTVFAYTQRTATHVDQLVPMGSGSLQRRRVEVISSSLWMRGWRARAESLPIYSPFWPAPPTDRLALARFRGTHAPPVDLADPDWRIRVDAQIAQSGACVIAHPTAAGLADAIRAVTTEPTDLGGVLVHPTVAGLTTVPDGYEATLIVDDGGSR